ncbi:uncharacterized protein Z520_08868 [Fonsecaea multimorphosa CBS 102226]|uniref:Voltage-gated hydrogen channel 1 n=1 Tax=Fonsecaea multimorphosa CBS 102226 TaxID=1442371 RepID=A0A0D2IDZ0_9EURO|nr:uncharacterized protein Z520_08868 [Fonsecaea multimorphosa CBS 102226]KIX95351.1 hypothetical protein Z520_08868 [Fonsecaea multimorphosa CBS 102226]OAL21147.1 hypothetical protein AYO22_08304 [Fonsecaea multimorphosa]
MADPETGQSPVQATSNTSEYTPLLPSDRQLISALHESQDFIACHIVKIHGEDSVVWKLRHSLQHWFSSKWGHYFVILLVSADICCIFADFLISLHMCEHAGEKGFNLKAWELADAVLDYASLVFSCLFMAELLGSVFAFGFRYFNSSFHIFDALVIIAAFIIDVLLRGPLEEAGSLVVVLRLWRVFKIIEEFSSGAEDQIAELQEKIDDLEREREDVMKENQQLKHRLRRGYEDADGEVLDGNAS